MKQRRPNAWAAGRAPACWQDAIERQTTRTKNLRRLSAWVQPLTDVTPKLRQGPLLGNCLAALTNFAVSSDDSRPAERPHAGPSRSSDPTDRAEHATRSTGDVPEAINSHSDRDAPSDTREPAKPIELARHIDRAQLSRWADAEMREQPGHAASPHQPIVPAAKSEMSSAAIRLDMAAQRRSPALTRHSSAVSNT